MASSLPSFPSFSVYTDAGTIGPRWEKYVKRIENLFTALNITNADRKKALLLHYAGEDVMDIFETLPEIEYAAPAGGGDPVVRNSCEKGRDALTKHFLPRRNKEYERFVFREATQKQGENIDAYHTRLQQLVTNCEFTVPDDEIKSQIIRCCTSQRLRRRALRDEMTLNDLLTLARTQELAEIQAAGMEQETANCIGQESANAVKHKKKYCEKKQTSSNYKQSNKPDIKNKCFNCGGNYPHEGSCPARGKSCSECGKANHFAVVCRSKRYGSGSSTKKYVKRLTTELTEESSDEEYAFHLSNKSKTPKVTVKINNEILDCVVDTGASVNVIPLSKLNKMKERPPIHEVQTKLFAYGNKVPLPLIGKCEIKLVHKNNITIDDFIVTENGEDILLSYKTANVLGIVEIVSRIERNTTPTDQTAGHIRDHSVVKLVKEYSDLFTGLGKLKDYKVKLHIDQTVKPVAQPYRRVPFHVRRDIEAQIKADEENDVIEDPKGPTPWVSPIVVVPKKTPGKVRVCIDMRVANEAIARERHATPTIPELISELNGSDTFTKLDLNQGYNQLELEEDSRYITTFASHVGLKQYKRLNFGITSAAEVFQQAIKTTLHGITGCFNISDDILIHSKKKDHLAVLRRVFQRLREKGLTLGKQKCEFNKDELEFYGHTFSKHGVAPSPEKIKMIKELESPKDASQVRSLLGMLNYCGQRFIAGYATLTHDLRELTKKDVKWKWTKKHEDSMTAIRDAL